MAPRTTTRDDIDDLQAMFGLLLDPNDIEEGEIVEMTEEQRITAAQSAKRKKNNKLKRERKVKRDARWQQENAERREQEEPEAEHQHETLERTVVEERERQAEQERKKEEQCHFDEQETAKQASVLEFVQAIFGRQDVHIHQVRKKPELLRKLQELEKLRNASLSSSDPCFPKDEILWLTKPGLHYVYDIDEKCLVFATRITPWADFDPAKLEKTQRCLATLMDYSNCTNAINTNAAQAKGKFTHGEGEGVTAPLRVGKLYAVGWHASMEAGKALVYYSVKSDKGTQFKEVLERLPETAAWYRENFFSMTPGAAQKMVDDSSKENVPSFDTFTLDGPTPQQPFANALTLTSQEFANYIHKDKDWSPGVFGIWWTTGMAGRSPKYAFDKSFDHSNVKGGEFLLAEYGVGVAFDQAEGLVENFWRGMQDWHCTLASKCDPGCTRWGSSVQITTKGVLAVQRFIRDHNASTDAVVDAYERIDNANRRTEEKKAKKHAEKQKIVNPSLNRGVKRRGRDSDSYSDS